MCSSCGRSSASCPPTCTIGSCTATPTACSPAPMRSSRASSRRQGVFAHQPVTDAMRARRGRCARARSAPRTWRDATLDTMSTGEARRVLIARALVHRPAALMLDEPTRGLDLVARHAFMERVRAVARRRHDDSAGHASRRRDHPGDRSRDSACATGGRVRRSESGGAHRCARERRVRRAACRRGGGTATSTFACARKRSATKTRKHERF